MRGQTDGRYRYLCSSRVGFMNQKQFATEVTAKLQNVGFTAYWAGGCVRDAILGRTPKDYDVATSATPDEVRALFGFKRTLPIGASFGVITIIGPKSAGQIEVATFRRDGGYSDGRRPDSIQFTDPREDALRRDFTINGMFYDPITDQTIDYVGGQEDILRRRIRAIGDPDERIEEDKLRILRGIRFAATYEFTIEEKTHAAIARRAAAIEAVSSERIGAEIVRMLGHPTFSNAIGQLQKTGLWNHVLPKTAEEILGERLSATSLAHSNQLKLSSGNQYRFETVAAVLLNEKISRSKDGQAAYLQRLQERWRLKNDQIRVIEWITKHWALLDQADQRRWSEVQPAIAHEFVWAGLDASGALGSHQAAQQFCRQCLTRSSEEIDPPPLLIGKDLIDLGIKPGPVFKQILETVRNQQLDQELHDRESARQTAIEVANQLRSS